MRIAEGFPGQRLRVLPRPMAQQALQRPGTRALLVTDCGYFPQARAHGRVRTEPIAQAVVLLCTEGRGWCTVDGVDQAVRAGQAVVIPPGVPHAYGSDPDDPWTLWWMHLDGQELPALLEVGSAVGPDTVRTPAKLFRAVALLEEVVELMERELSPATLFAASAAAWHFLATLADAAPPQGSHSDVVGRAKDRLQRNLADGTSVAALAAEARLSPSHFATLFRKQVGLPVLQFQTQLRMARARELLDTTDLAVSAIAAQVGYPDAFYFSRQFRSIHGTTPLRYRSQSKG
ncbi:AraC family transcriptional regulator [Arthrobacter sp. HY1533]|uniref:AraC family transcriptional regulator n=1 Tax=Arthrobacter sp. HY1533 TaxID=2970919 RepID=UPI0022B9E24B|nr:AraC family transcriptional regulator [Arthrobacter sp. HY1533]